MLRITVDVNGTVVNRVFVHNNGRKFGRVNSYDAAIMGDDDMILGVEGVEHERSRPWHVLVAEVFRNIPRSVSV